MQDVHNDLPWRIARKRAEFKKGLFTFIIINTFLWAIWWFSMGRYTGFSGFPWPSWIMLGFSLVLAYQYFEAYGNTRSLTQQDYEKLKRQHGRT